MLKNSARRPALSIYAMQILVSRMEPQSCRLNRNAPIQSLILHRATWWPGMRDCRPWRESSPQHSNSMSDASFISSLVGSPPAGSLGSFVGVTSMMSGIVVLCSSRYHYRSMKWSLQLLVGIFLQFLLPNLTTLATYVINLLLEEPCQHLYLGIGPQSSHLSSILQASWWEIPLHPRALISLIH